MFHPEYILPPQREPKLEIGANLGSFAPWIMANQVGSITSRLKERGFQFVSTVPMRNIDKPSVLPVRYVEDAWNPTQGSHVFGLWEVMQGKRAHDPLAPQFQDLLLFPDRQRAGKMFRDTVAKNRGINVVTHNLFDAALTLSESGLVFKTLLEVNPGMTDLMGDQLTLDELYRALGAARSVRGSQFREFASPLSGVVFDTKHTRRGMRPDEIARISRPGQPVQDVLGGYQNVLRVLGPDVQLIDFQALDPQELRDALNNRGTELADVLSDLITQLPGVPIRLEIQLDPLDHFIPGRVMTQMLEAADFIKGLHGEIYPENKS